MNTGSIRFLHVDGHLNSRNIQVKETCNAVSGVAIVLVIYSDVAGLEIVRKIQAKLDLNVTEIVP